jgi:F-type H+-transporting ATPase subunit alpha
VSRVGGNAQIKPMKRVAGRLRLDLSQYRELEAFAQFGSDLDPDTQRTLARGERLVATLNQKERSPLAVEDQVLQIYAATNGYLDRINVERVPDFLAALTARAHSEMREVLDQVREGNWDDAVVEKVDSFVKEFLDDFGYDLDEDGQPVEGGDSERVKERRSEDGSQRAEGGSDQGGEGSEEKTREQEPARA